MTDAAPPNAALPAAALVGPAAPASSTGTLDLVTRMSLILLLFSDIITTQQWEYQALLKVPAVLGLILPPLHLSRVFWAVMTGLMLVKTIDHAAFQDNHLYLVTWWNAAILFALFSPEPARVLAHSARLMIGLSFALAMLWKAALSDDFLNGRYFHFTLLTDPRFADLAAIVGGIDTEAAAQNRAAFAAVSSPAAPERLFDLVTTPAIRSLAVAMTVYTVVIESLIFIAFLWPRVGRGVSRFRDGLLMIFAVTVYITAPVTTFGWTLCAMGLAQLEPHRRRTRIAYLATATLVLLYEFVPFLSIARSMLGK